VPADDIVPRGSRREAQDSPSSTRNGGQPPDSVDDAPPSSIDPVDAALDGAKRMARSRGSAPRRRRKPTQDDRRRGGYSSAWPDDTDPTPLGDVVAGYLVDRGWEQPITEARVFTDWATIVGPGVAAHCAPAALRDGELRIAAESTAWASQLRLLGGKLLARIVAELGPTVVTRVVITGPVAPSWKHGPRSVRGARGPRDTYG
jgi:predicted nucleic acid-binding Zn ribbon protein